MFLEISENSQENTCARVYFYNRVAGLRPDFIKKETLAQVFSCEICEISKNTFLHRTPLAAASERDVRMTLSYFKAEVHLEPSPTSKMEIFAKVFNG